MQLPTYEQLLLPSLHVLRDGEEHENKELVAVLSEQFHLGQEDREKLLPSGKEPVFQNRIRWAVFYLRHANLVESVRRGFVRISVNGKTFLEKNPTSLSTKDLEKIPAFRDWRGSLGTKEESKTEEMTNLVITPEEQLERASESLHAALIAELMDQMKTISWSSFEGLVIEVLRQMGYGGSQEDAARALGKSGDRGVDGVIKEDPLGLDVIYIQAKHWENPVGGKEVREFVGSVSQHRATKGVFITTSSFTKEGRLCVESSDKKVVLVDGIMLANIMIDHDIGVTTVGTYKVKRVDSDFFEDR